MEVLDPVLSEPVSARNRLCLPGRRLRQLTPGNTPHRAHREGEAMNPATSWKEEIHLRGNRTDTWIWTGTLKTTPGVSRHPATGTQSPDVSQLMLTSVLTPSVGLSCSDASLLGIIQTEPHNGPAEPGWESFLLQGLVGPTRHRVSASEPRSSKQPPGSQAAFRPDTAARRPALPWKGIREPRSTLSPGIHAGKLCLLLGSTIWQEGAPTGSAAHAQSVHISEVAGVMRTNR